jgi:protein-S-isoprenylcysteine O-methyltransferase Ste14
MLTFAVFVVSCLDFTAFSWSLRFHFASTRMPLGMIALSIASLAIFGLTLHALLTTPAVTSVMQVSLALYVSCGILFGLSVMASRKARLRVAFDIIDQPTVVAEGPYRFIRHPFYTSYIAFWLASALAAGSVVVAVAFPFFAATYVLLARREEQGLLASPIGEAYRVYQSRTGFMFPRIRS